MIDFYFWLRFGFFFSIYSLRGYEMTAMCTYNTNRSIHSLFTSFTHTRNQPDTYAVFSSVQQLSHGISSAHRIYSQVKSIFFFLSILSHFSVIVMDSHVRVFDTHIPTLQLHDYYYLYSFYSLLKFLQSAWMRLSYTCIFRTI